MPPSVKTSQLGKTSDVAPNFHHKNPLMCTWVVAAVSQSLFWTRGQTLHKHWATERSVFVSMFVLDTRAKYCTNTERPNAQYLFQCLFLTWGPNIAQTLSDRTLSIWLNICSGRGAKHCTNTEWRVDGTLSICPNVCSEMTLIAWWEIGLRNSHLQIFIFVCIDILSHGYSKIR